MNQWQATVKDKHNGLRLDKYLGLRFEDASRSHFSYLIKEGQVTINGQVETSPRYKVKEGDEVAASDTHKSDGTIPLCDIDIPIVYEDDYLMVINKPIDLIVHPVGKTMDSVIGALINKGAKLSTIDPERPGVVHRLDKTTSGVMILAKDNETHEKIASIFKQREIYKEYCAVVRGRLRFPKGVVDEPLKRIAGAFKMHISQAEDAKHAITEYECLNSNDNLHLMKIVIKTGRMHQIRVHMKHIGVPVLGDTKYGGAPADRIMLHAHKLGFKHPVTEEDIVVEAPIPQEFLEKFSCK